MICWENLSTIIFLILGLSVITLDGRAVDSSHQRFIRNVDLSQNIHKNLKSLLNKKTLTSPQPVEKPESPYFVKILKRRPKINIESSFAALSKLGTTPPVPRVLIDHRRNRNISIKPIIVTTANAEALKSENSQGSEEGSDKDSNRIPNVSVTTPSSLLSDYLSTEETSVESGEFAFRPIKYKGGTKLSQVFIKSNSASFTTTTTTPTPTTQKYITTPVTTTTKGTTTETTTTTTAPPTTTRSTTTTTETPKPVSTDTAPVLQNVESKNKFGSSSLNELKIQEVFPEKKESEKAPRTSFSSSKESTEITTKPSVSSTSRPKKEIKLSPEARLAAQKLLLSLLATTNSPPTTTIQLVEKNKLSEKKKPRQEDLVILTPTQLLSAYKVATEKPTLTSPTKVVTRPTSSIFDLLRTTSRPRPQPSIFSSFNSFSAPRTPSPALFGFSSSNRNTNYARTTSSQNTVSQRPRHPSPTSSTTGSTNGGLGGSIATLFQLPGNILMGMFKAAQRATEFIGNAFNGMASMFGAK